MMDGARLGGFIAYTYIISFLILNLVLVVNIIVGLQSYAFKKYSLKRDILKLISTLSVRATTEADDKYSAVISAPFPLCILNFVFGAIVISLRSTYANICLLAFYYVPIFVVCFISFIIY